MGYVGAAEFTEELCIDLFGMKTVLPSLLSYDAAMTLFNGGWRTTRTFPSVPKPRFEDLRHDDFFEISV